MSDVSLKSQTINPALGGLSRLSEKPGAATDGKIESGKDFFKELEGKLKAGLTAEQSPVSRLKFSNHAVERMQNRGIRFSPEQLGKISDAVTKAAQKGAKETLVLTDESALIVSIKNNTVVTVMDKMALKENVFTNIDSTVVL